ncbi:MAG: nucleotidyltransferase domain-containing protein [Candidatus Aminicenantes bacterium]|nr:nucleotidyltransferase domain-containing protein [Candidatus Aminicenantes bacterium]
MRQIKFKLMVNKDNRQQKKKIFARLKEILIERDEILFVYIHGSFLDNLPFHDIDVALYVDPKEVDSLQSFDYSLGLSVELSQKLGKDIDTKVMNYAPVGFQHSVFKNGKLLFSKTDQRTICPMEGNFSSSQDLVWPRSALILAKY